MQSCNPWCSSSTNYFGLSLRLDEEKKKKRKAKGQEFCSFIYFCPCTVNSRRDFSALSTRTASQKANVRNRNLWVWSEEEWDSWDKMKFFWFPNFFQIKTFLKWLYWDIQYRIQTAASWETQYPWEMLRTGNHGAWVQKTIGKVSLVGFHQRIFVQVKHLIPVLAGYISPYINVDWMLSHSKVINRIISDSA